MATTAALAEKAIGILRENDRGHYTVPTKGLYPFQWNWDSCFTALGQAHYDLGRAWTEIETLFAHQWEDGMVPHMVFHEPAPDYSPGPEVWGTGRNIPTSGITQLPIAGFAINQLWLRSRGLPDVEQRARALLARVDSWHAWFYRTRDPQHTGLVAIIHPWESRDNSIDWDEAFERVPTEGVMPYRRSDISHAEASTRPTREQYDRYIWLVQHFRGLDWDSRHTHDASPFQVVDAGFNAILIRSAADIADLAESLGETEIAARNRAWAARGVAALEMLWDDDAGQYQPFDRLTSTRMHSPSIGGLIPIFAPIPPSRANAIVRTLQAIGDNVRFLVPSHDPRDPRFDVKRYWRGPIWLVCNYMLIDGLRRFGADDLADRIRRDSLELINANGFSEYYDPQSGAALGGGRFSWTAAMVLEFVGDAP